METRKRLNVEPQTKVSSEVDEKIQRISFDVQDFVRFSLFILSIFLISFILNGIIVSINQTTVINETIKDEPVDSGVNHVDINDSVESKEFDFMATVEEDIEDIRLLTVNCSKTGYKYEKSINAEPEQCGVAITDQLVSRESAIELRQIAEKLIAYIGETTTVNRESLNLQWVNLHTVFRKSSSMEGLFTNYDYQLILNTSMVAKKLVSSAFGIAEKNLHFTSVCQFTRYEPIAPFSEFRHIDKVRSPELVVTSILWLSTVDEDFTGGRLEFLYPTIENGQVSPLLIEPKLGRYAAWTSSHENPHGVHELFYGERYALIFAFTTKKTFGHETIEDLRTWSVLRNKPSFL